MATGKRDSAFIYKRPLFCSRPLPPCCWFPAARRRPQKAPNPQAWILTFTCGNTERPEGVAWPPPIKTTRKGLVQDTKTGRRGASRAGAIGNDRDGGGIWFGADPVRL